MKQGHTEGPWQVEACDEIRGLVIRGKRRAIAGIHNCRSVGTNGMPISCDLTPAGRAESEANARLIAAAPELLAACKTLLADGERRCKDDGANIPQFLSRGWSQIWDAVSKAEGRAP